jgi:pyruvate formate-lyase/glycerol dehydratase family glycyl radical enzyme
MDTLTASPHTAAPILTKTPGRVGLLKQAVETSPYSICIERAVLVTEYFRNKANGLKPMILRKAEALAYILKNKTVRIYPNELIVGSTTSKRVAGPLYPELHGLPVMEDLMSFEKRKLNPLQISGSEKIKLIREVVPYWINKFLAYKSFSKKKDMIKFTLDQLSPKFFLINETGGIGHIIPDYEMIINKGIKGIVEEANQHLSLLVPEDEKWAFYKAILAVCDGVCMMTENYLAEVERMILNEPDNVRSEELGHIAENLRHVPVNPAGSFYEALQSIWLMHIAITLEGLDNGISLGRMDQYLYPFYKRDIEAGTLTREGAKELLGCFAVKTSEMIPVFSGKISSSHGGLLSGQALTIGGTDGQGNDVTNELSFIFLELMDEVKMRQPNYHARIDRNSPQVYIDKIMDNLVRGVNSPSVYNDDVIVNSLKKCGMSDEDANAYSTLGCVELCSPGRTFGSTDAALFNIPICLEMALNEGKLFGSSRMSGAGTKALADMGSIEDVKDAFERQLAFQIDRLQSMLSPIELGNRDYHPTPLTSAMIQGCMDKGVDVTAGGAIYNFSGVQGVGVTDTGDSLYVLNEMVFVRKNYTLERVVRALKNNFSEEEKMRKEFLGLPKFGNDNPIADRYSKWVADAFYDVFEGRYNTRGGRFVAGFYSTTTHYSFGLMTGAMASGRMRGATFTSGIAPSNGADKKGPTALFNSIASIDFGRAHNGVNVNAKFDTATLKGAHGKKILEALIMTYFKKGGIQAQLNVLDTEMLKDAKLHPDKYPWLIVRVSGYSAYFNDLSPAMKDEIIQRSSHL